MKIQLIPTQDDRFCIVRVDNDAGEVIATQCFKELFNAKNAADLLEQVLKELGAHCELE